MMVPMVNAMSEVPLELESNLIVKAAAAATVRLAKGKGVAMLSTRPTRSPRQRRLPWPWRSLNEMALLNSTCQYLTGLEMG